MKRIKTDELQPEIVLLREKKLVGNRMSMSLADNKTGLLWQNFIPRLKNISNRATQEMISMQIYSKDHFKMFDPTRPFEKWAAVEVTELSTLPVGLEAFTLEGGQYAVFNYKGSSTDHRIFQYIFEKWLPASEFVVDDRPHFEILGEKYRNADPESEEEIWIPVTHRRSH